MDAADLRVFEAVARLGGMNRAASELNTVQSNVTARIRALEGELRTPLFHRTSRGVSLTAAGQRLVPYAVRLARLLQEATHATRDDGTPRGPLLIGSLETTAALRLAPLLSGFVASYPEVDLSLKTGTSCELVQDVLEHRVEGAFICGPAQHPDLQQEIVFREELVVLTTPNVTSLDACLHGKDVRIIVLRSGCSYRQRLESWLADRGIVGLRQLEFGTLEAITSCVGAGLGITLLPRSLIGPVCKQGRVAAHPLPAGEGLVDTVFIRRRDRHTSSALEAFLARARPALADLQAAE